MIAWLRAPGIGAEYEIRAVLSAELIQADLPMFGAGLAANIESQPNHWSD